MLPRVNMIKCNEADFLLSVKDTVISRELYFNGTWEHNILLIAKILLSDIQNPWVLDIGANLGAFTIPIAQHIAPNNGMVSAFEPQRIVYYQLCGNIFLNSLDNCYAYNFALGADECEVDIPELDFNAHNNIGAFSLQNEYVGEYRGLYLSDKKHRVKQIKLDNLPPPSDSVNLSLIKIDVEGWELPVLRHGQNLLAQHGYPPILFEVWNTDYFVLERVELLDFIQSLGYELTQLGEMDYLAQHPSFPRRLNLIHHQEHSRIEIQLQVKAG